MTEELSKANQNILLAVAKGYTIDFWGAVTGPSGRVLKANPDGGYRRFSVRGDSRYDSRKVRVHKFQAYDKYGEEMFKEGILVRHLDGDNYNNCKDNLALGTEEQNQADRDPEDIKAYALVAATSRRRFSDRVMREMKWLFRKRGWSYKQIMEKYDIKHPGTLAYMLNTKYKTTKGD